jgi:CRISPR-associated protein Cas5t
LQERRYGIPFAGDNNLLFDHLDVLGSPMPCHWYVRIDSESSPLRGSCRLTIGIDREESHRTTMALFAPISAPLKEPPEPAWTWTPRSPAS